MIGLLLVFGLSLGLGLLITPLCRVFAVRYGLVDHPDGRRKLHAKAMPVAGGGAVLLSLAGGLCVAYGVPGLGNGWRTQDGLFLAGLLLASLVICLVGLLDDLRGPSCSTQSAWAADRGGDRHELRTGRTQDSTV